MFRLVVVAFVAGHFALGIGSAQEPAAKSQPESPRKRTVFTLNHASPAAISRVLAQQFEGQAKVSVFLSELLVSGSPAVLEEVAAVIARLDRKPSSVEVEVILADVRLAPDGKEPDVSDAAKVDALVKAGQATAQRVKVTAVEGQPVTSTTGGDKPYSTSVTIQPGGFGGGRGRGGAGEAPPGGFGGGGPAAVQRSVNYRAVGSTIKLTARVGAENAVTLDLNVQDNKIRTPEVGDEAAATGGAPAFETGALATQVAVPAGKTIIAQAIRTDGKASGAVSYVIVTARVLEGIKPGK